MSSHTVPRWRLAWLPGLMILALACNLGAQAGGATEAPALPPTEAPPGEATAPPAAAPAQEGTGPTLSGCQIFPADNIWNTPVDSLPVDANSDLYIDTIGADTTLHPDFGAGEYEGAPIGIPFADVGDDVPRVQVAFTYDDESDPGPYPIPANPPIEGGPDSDGDRHILILDHDNCDLYELFYAFPEDDGTWSADSGAIFNLDSNALRPDAWTSADAAGLPILPGLVRYDEVASGEIRHALRFTAPETRMDYVWPGRHHASDLTDEQYPPLGLRFRLRADFDLSGFSPDVQVILRAMQRYGMFLADNGSAWFISGAPDDRWDNDVLDELKDVPGSAFEAVDSSSLMVDPDSGQAAGVASAAAPEGTLPPLPPTSAPGAAGQGGQITYTLENQGVFRIQAEAGAEPENVSAILDGVAPGVEDGWLFVSPDGAWYILNSDRFDPECEGWACLAVLNAALTSAEVIRAGGELVHPNGAPAIASGGSLVVYGAEGGPHTQDLWVITRNGDEWTAPALLTADSPYAYQDIPAISPDGSRVAFDCADEPYGAAGTALCEVGTNGTDFRVLLRPQDFAEGTAQNALHRVVYAPDDSLVFESDWDGGERIWRLPPAGDPFPVSPGTFNDNSPCVLPDGRIASLWLNRPSSSGVHELKMMPADGSSYTMLLEEVDVFDIGLGCGA